MDSKLNTLIGKRINEITVIDIFRDPSKKHYALAKVFCHYCNNTKNIVATENLWNGKIKSCGCRKNKRPWGKRSPRIEDLKGKKFTKLTVIELDGKTLSHKTKWICKCECGKEVSVKASQLKNGQTRSCGCIRRGENNSKYTGYKEITGLIWSRIKRNANDSKRRKAIPFSITVKDVWEQFIKQNKKCALSGIPLDMQNGASLDRIDSKKGYEIGNIQWVYKTINTMKWDLPQDDFIKFCKLVALFKS